MGVSEKEVATHDFGVSSRLSREASLGLRRIHQSLTDDLEFVLSQSFNQDVRAAGVEISQVRYAQFIETAAERAYHAVLTSEQLNGDVQLALPQKTTSMVLSLTLGHSAGRTGRDLTAVDQRIVDVQMPSIVAALNRSFDPYYKLGLDVSKAETNPKLVKLIGDDEPVVMLELELTVLEESFSIVLCYPQDSLAPVLVTLSDLERAASAEALNVTSDIARSMMGVSLPITVQLPVWNMSANHIGSLSVGDVVQTGVAATLPPVLCIAGKPTLNIRPVTCRARAAAEVLGDLNEGLIS